METKEIIYYPIIKIPQYFILENYKKISPPLPVEPQKPKMKYPIDNRKPFFSTSIYLIIFLLFISIVAPSTFVYTFYGMLILGIYKYISHNKQQNLYYSRLRTEEQNHSFQLQEYSKEWNKWKIQKMHADKLKEISNDNVDSVKSRKLFLKELIAFKEISLKETEFNKLGVSEILFFNALYNEFRDKITHNKTVFVSGENSYYTPDFIYFDEEIFIDIEIDEPYTLEEHKPIHYEFNDESRDDFFVDLNWGIIRFTEKQIIKETDNCIETIKSIISIMEGKTNLYNIYTTKEKAWTKDDAVNLAKNFFREDYLNLPKVMIRKKTPNVSIFNVDCVDNKDYIDDLPF